MTGLLRRGGAFSVDIVALAAVVVEPFSLYVVLLLYWADSIVGTVRQVCQTVVAAPREAYSPTEPPAVTRSGDASPFRFLTPKLGTVQPVEWLPPIAVHNLKPGVMGVLALSLTALAVGGTATVVDPPFTLQSWPTAGILLAGGLAVLVKHGWAFRRFVRSARPPARRMLPFGRWLGSILVALPVVAVDTVHAGADFDPGAGFAAVAFVLVVGRLAVEVRRDTPPTGADSFELSAPVGRPSECFLADRGAVLLAGAMDGIVPRLEWDVLTVASRLTALLLLSVGGFVAAGVVGLALPASVVVGVVGSLVLFGLGFGLVGLAQFAVAFGAMEYRLYDDELVAYDTRLDAVQWRAPLAGIRAVAVERNHWLAPPGTDAATVTLDRTDLAVEQSPYGFYRQTLAYVETPERVADRLRKATGRDTGQ
ncbi:hypothetical protein [Haloarchaeobius sp. TZWSO28]|uniref:hypothetical protein n=1 Tax=Haloarchaeobius sp. TZWSO28 TaxID=3446119 RepID=UPI003EBBD562